MPIILNGIKISMIVLLDGLTNVNGLSGHLLLEQKIKASLNEFRFVWKTYNPVNNNGTVETTEVYPYFFGLKPKDNPGRAGFELFETGDLPENVKGFITVRTEAPDKIINSCKGRELFARESNYSSDKKTVLIAARSSVSIKNLLGDSQHKLKASHYYMPSNTWHTDNYRRLPYSLIGWCHGALRTAFSLVGVNCNYDDEPTYAHGNYYSHGIITHTLATQRIVSSFRYNLVPIMYLKHFAHEARHGLEKSHAATEVASMLECAINALKSNESTVSVLLISDHNSEIGEDFTRSGYTVYGIITDNECDAKQFSACMPDAVEQAELVRLLSLNLRNWEEA